MHIVYDCCPIRRFTVDGVSVEFGPRLVHSTRVSGCAAWKHVEVSELIPPLS